MCNDAQSRLAAIIYGSQTEQTGCDEWQSRIRIEQSVDVFEGRSTHLYFFSFFVLCLFYNFKWQPVSNLFIFLYFFFLSVTLYSVWVKTCHWHFSVNKFKTLDKTNKINTIFCRLNLYLLAYLSVFHQKCEQTVNILQELNKSSNSPAQTSTSQIRFNLSRGERWLTRRVRWDRQDDGGRVSKRNVKAPVLSLLTSEFDINLSQGCQSTLQMRNSPISTKWKVNKL